MNKNLMKVLYFNVKNVFLSHSSYEIKIREFFSYILLLRKFDRKKKIYLSLINKIIPSIIHSSYLVNIEIKVQIMIF